MKIAVTGGHLSPALAVSEELKAKAEIVFIGRKYDFDKSNAFSLEYREITKLGVLFYHLNTGRFTRIFNLAFLINLIKVPIGFFQALSILLTEKPDLILSFGGYISFPVCSVGYLLGIPVFIHEQTVKPGLANRLLAGPAKKIFLAFPQTKQYFPVNKVVVSGNPVRRQLLRVVRKPFEINKTQPVIYITGGSLGSHSINQIIEKIITKLLSEYILIHQTGQSAKYRDWQKLLRIKAKLPSRLKKNYFLKRHFYSEELGYIYSISDLVVGRSGANTFFELIAWKKPAVLIPLPWSANQEQLKHAELLAGAGVAEIFPQNNPADELFSLIGKVQANLKDYKKNYKKVELLYEDNAARIIVKTILAQITAKV